MLFLWFKRVYLCILCFWWDSKETNYYEGKYDWASWRSRERSEKDQLRYDMYLFCKAKVEELEESIREIDLYFIENKLVRWGASRRKYDIGDEVFCNGHFGTVVGMDDKGYNVKILGNVYHATWKELEGER